MNWISLTTISQLEEIKSKSFEKPQILFKHSTRCSISAMVLNRLEKWENTTDADFYYLDLIAYRIISNKIAEDFNVFHESPQILVIKNGKCIYDENHNAIAIEDIILDTTTSSY